ncbi:MAG: TetR/AcrR family transcriptional regulator [Eubacteriales bacterium]|nr:TetR/AcrR family transcriptional regulator [Eubacteriales bacterium]
MRKSTIEQNEKRKKEIVDACEKLYQTTSFKEVTLKEIAKRTSLTRTSIYNYFQTKEEIFLALLKHEYELWIEELEIIIRSNKKLTKEKFAQKIAKSLEHREQLLKIMSMNMYDMEANSRMERLVEFKLAFGKSLNVMFKCVEKFFPNSNANNNKKFIYQFFPFIYGIYPYTEVTKKQKKAMLKAGIDYNYISIYQITYNCLLQLITGLVK